MTTPAAETKSIGLLADALLSWFLQHHLDSFIVTGQFLLIYRDLAVWTVPSGRENSRPSIGTLQKLMPTPTQTATSHTTGPLGFIAESPDTVLPREFLLDKNIPLHLLNPDSAVTKFILTSKVSATYRNLKSGNGNLTARIKITPRQSTLSPSSRTS